MMFRQPIIALILLAVLPSCGANKELEQLNSDDSDRITILSILPKSGTGEIVSALFVTHHQNGKLALTGFYDRMNAEITASDFVYIDSLDQLNFETFPFVWSAVKQDSLKQSEYICSIGTRESVLKNQGEDQTFLSSFRVNYPRIEFPLTDSNAMSVQALHSPSCMVKEINGRKLKQESVLFLSVVNQSNPLFTKTGLKYHWINAQLNTGESIIVFFSTDFKNTVSLLYTSDPKISIEFSNKTIRINTEALSLQVLGTKKNSEKLSYQFESIQLMQNQQAIGHGICYTL